MGPRCAGGSSGTLQHCCVSGGTLLVSEFTTLPGARHWTILLSALSGGKRGELLLPIVRFYILAARMGMKRVFYFSVDLVQTRVSFVFIN